MNRVMNKSDFAGNYFLDWILIVRSEDKVNRPQTVPIAYGVGYS